MVNAATRRRPLCCEPPQAARGGALRNPPRAYQRGVPRRPCNPPWRLKNLSGCGSLQRPPAGFCGHTTLADAVLEEAESASMPQATAASLTSCARTSGISGSRSRSDFGNRGRRPPPWVCVGLTGTAENTETGGGGRNTGRFSTACGMRGGGRRPLGPRRCLRRAPAALR